jgi:succinate-semialdehyde dehydrogenase/glutarate-semialdehyde dehydrogenase
MGGKSLARQAANQLTQCTLELGGHAPVIVFDDVHIASTVAEIVTFKFECAGQSCNAPSRLYVHKNIYDKFLDRLRTAIDDIRVGDGLNDNSTMGPLQHRRRLEGVRALLDDAITHGANQIPAATAVPSPGFFVAPTLLTDVPDTALIGFEEPFGPILPVWPFESEEQVVELANRVDYGLAAFCFSKDVARARRIAARLEVGYLAINGLTGIPYDAPTGGVRDSGYGIEGGLEGIADFMRFKFVTEFNPTQYSGSEDAR